MSRRRKRMEIPKSKSRNKQRDSTGFMDHIREANRRASISANRPLEGRSLRHVQASLAETQEYDDATINGWSRLLRWILALMLLPLCYVTSATFMGQFSNEALHKGFWHSKEFWFFTIGALWMSGWFFTGLARRFFLFLYVLGHELTHALFVYLHLGWVSDFKATADGGYIATNKTNILISLSPYFFPFWSIALLGIYGIIQLCTTMPPYAEDILLGLTGATWTFHILWTLWMIPRDQPDLKENDTFFSLVIIYLANITLLSVMLCFAAETLTWHAFFASWCINAENLYDLTRAYLLSVS